MFRRNLSLGPSHVLDAGCRSLLSSSTFCVFLRDFVKSSIFSIPVVWNWDDFLCYFLCVIDVSFLRKHVFKIFGHPVFRSCAKQIIRKKNWACYGIRDISLQSWPRTINTHLCGCWSLSLGIFCTFWVTSARARVFKINSTKHLTFSRPLFKITKSFLL